MAGALRLGLAIVVALALAPASAGAAVPDDFAGVNPSKHDTFDAARRVESMNLQSTVGVGLQRVPFDWSAFETSPGQFDFSRYDPVVADAASRGLRLLPILFDPPSFRSSRGTSTRRGMFPPNDFAAMGNFAAALVQRYGPAGSLWAERPDLPRVPIRSWQVWNEPNIPSFWPTGAAAAAYTDLLKEVAASIRAADPGAEIVAAGLPNSSHGPSVKTYLSAMYDAGAAAAFDTLAIHPYSEDFYGLMDQVHEMRAIASDHGDDAPIWVTELGWPTDGPPGYEIVSEDEQARLVTQTLRALAQQREAIGIRGFTYFYWRESAADPASDEPDSIWGHVGLIAPGGAKPAFYAFVDVVAEMRERAPIDPGDPRLPPPNEPGPDVDPPPCGRACEIASLGRLGVTPSAIRPARRGGAIGRTSKCSKPGGRTKLGACLLVRLGRAAPLLVEVARLGARKAVRIGRKERLGGIAGLNRLWLSGRASGRVLRPGLYRLTVAVLDDDGGRSVSRSIKFRVLPEPNRSIPRR